MKYPGETNSMSERASRKWFKAVKNSLKLWNHYNFEGISRSTVSRSDTKINWSVDHKLKSNQNRFKSQAKKSKIIEKKFQLGWN